MKNFNQKTKRNRITVVLFFVVLVAAELCAISAEAQYGRKRYNKRNSGPSNSNVFIGAEALGGNRSFKISSDIAQFDNVSVVEEGKTIGGVIGFNSVLFRVRSGYYTPSASVGKRIELGELSIGMNVAPLQFTRNKPKYFEPYIVMDIDVNKVHFYGTPFPPKPLQPAGLPNACTCPCCPPAEAAPEETQPEPDPSEVGFQEVYLGKIKVVQMGIGAGIMCNITGKKTFAKLFAEGKYGANLNTTTSTIEFRNTQINNQFSISFGVIMGINARGW